jgi:hypothetical protein
MVFPTECGIKSAIQIYQAIDNNMLKMTLYSKCFAVGWPATGTIEPHRQPQ